MSNFILELLDKLGAESRKLQNHSSVVHEVQAISIADFQKAYEVWYAFNKFSTIYVTLIE